MSLVWRDQLSVGNDVIDSDHRYLIEIINRVERSLGTQNQSELSAALDSLSQYSKVHFVREEKIARAAGYTQVPGLNKSHDTLLKQLDQVRREIEEMGQEWSSTAVEHFTNLLRSWLVDHVIKEDLLMKPVLQRYYPDFDGEIQR
ncbi:MAG: hemerythrin family protein [Gallionella sp.]|nr:hemerythrin family protein [Gallionella sp.]